MMNYRINMKPFNKFWIDCYYNSILSIILSKEPSYIEQTYMNSYRYFSYDPEELCLGIDVSRKKFSKDLHQIVKTREINFNKLDNFTGEIKEYINNEIPIGVLVDLFYWLPNTIVYRQKHWIHYSMIVGYDEERSEYIIFDEDSKGYREFIITEEKLMKAFMPNSEYSQAILFEQIANIPLKKVNALEIKSNCEKINDDIKVIMERQEIWRIDGREKSQALKMMIASMSRIFNCQISNQFLIRQLIDEDILKNNASNNEMINTFLELENRWHKLHNYLIKMDISKRKVDYLMLNQNSCECLNKEKEIWTRLLDCIY